MGCGYQGKPQHFRSPCCFPGWGQKWHGNVPQHPAAEVPQGHMEVMESAGTGDEMLLMIPKVIQQSEQVEDGFLLPSCQTFMGKYWDYR